MEMSEQESPWTNGGSGDYTLEPDGGEAPQVVSKAALDDRPGHNANDRKRTRSSDSDSARSSDSNIETSLKRPKVADDISFELSEKVSIPPVEKDVIEDQNSNNNSNQSGPGKKSIKQQVDDLVAERGMLVEYEFIQPPGYQYTIGQKDPSGTYKVHLNIVKLSKLENGTEERQTVQLFSGQGSSPYEAIRTASKKARDFLSNLSGDFPNSNQPSNGDIKGLHKNGESIKETGSDEDKDSNDGVIERGNAKEENNHKDSDSSEDEDSNVDEDGDSRTGDDETSEVETEDKDVTKWLLSLQSFFAKAFAPKLESSISIQYSLLDQSESNARVKCSIGNLAVEAESSSFDMAKNESAKRMMDKIESIISAKGDIIKVIAPPPPFKDETVVSEEEEDSKDGGNKVIEAETLDSSDEETEAVKCVPRTKTQDMEPGPSEMMPGVEYCMAFMRTDRPTERPIVMDVANIGRRTRCGVARMLLSSLHDGDKSDEEEEEGRMLETFQEMMALAGALSDRSKVKLAEMFSRSSLGPIQRQLQGMMPGLMPQHQPQYPVHPKHRLLPGASYQPPAPVEPPKPVIQPLKNLCQFPMPGQIEGVGAVTVSLEDYKTLAAGTFLNDVIIDFYLKHLQYSKFSEKDKNSAHIFTTFWFSRLTSKPSPIEARKDPVIRRHDRVKRWTRKVNIFEKDFVVIPINENYHWYLAIICYPGLVGCQSVESEEKCSQPAQQRNRRRAKDKIKKIKAQMNALPRKDTSDERDEPFASEDEVEHEDDSVDVEMWKNRFVEWEKMEVIRKAEEERRMVEMERQRREYEERMRQYHEEQKKIYEQQLKEQEEALRRQLEEEQEDLGEEEEAWDDENYDEEGNPIEAYDDGIMGDYNEYGEPVEMVTVPQGMFSDAGDYKTSVDILGAAFGSVRGEAMAADWDDWGEEVDMDTDAVVGEVLRDTIDSLPVFASMVCHNVTIPAPVFSSPVSSMISHSVTQAVCQELVHNVEVTEEQCLSSSVVHTVSAQTTSDEVHVAAIEDRLFTPNNDEQQQDQTEEVPKIAQVDGMNEDSSSDEDMEQDDDDDTNDEHKVPNPQMSQDETSQSAGDDDSVMSVDEVVFNQAQDNSEAARSESETEEEIERKEDSDSSSEDEDNNEMRGEINNRNDEDENSRADSYNSDFDEDDDRERNNEKYSDESSTATEGLENERLDVREEEDEETKDEAPRVQADSDSEIEEIQEVEEPTASNVNNSEDDLEDENDGDDDEGSDSEPEDEQESDFEEEDISNDVPVKQPCILVFDSLGGRKERQARLCAVLRDYLTMEFKEKYPGQTREFSPKTIPGCAPKVPQQPNLTDCGIYVCHNVETFFKNPIQDYTLPIRSLKNWFPDSEPRVKRRDVATLIRQLATEQNKDKLEQLILPDLVFVEPEKPKPAPVSNPGQRSDGEEEDDMDDDYISDDEYDSDEERNNKRYRSEGSSDEDRSPQRRRHNDSEDDFDSGAVYGAPVPVDPSPIRRLPPGISVVRSGQDNGSSAEAEQFSNSPRQSYPTPLRKLPPGISISRQQAELPTLPPGVTISSQGPQDPVNQSTPSQRPAMSPFKSFLSSQSSPPVAPIRKVFSNAVTVQGDVTMEDVSDCSDEATIFDLDQPDYTRTFLSPNSFQALKELRNQPPASTEDELNSSFTMVSHQVAESVIDSCLASMVAHQVFVNKEDHEDIQDEAEVLAQVDGMNDFDSEDETLGEPAQSVPVNEQAEAVEAPVIAPAVEVAADVINPPEEVVQSANEEYSLPETTEQHDVGEDHEAFQGDDMMEAAEVYPEEFQVEGPQEFGVEAQAVSEESYNIPTEVSVENVQPSEVVNSADDGIASAFEAAVADAVENDIVNVTEEVPIVDSVDIMNAEENGDMDDQDRSEDFNEDEEFVSDYDEEDSRDGQQEAYQPPPVKRARVSSDAEVVLDSDDDDLGGQAAQPQQLPSSRAAPPGPGVFPGYPGHMVGMTQQQQYLAAAQQQAMMMGHSSGQFPGLSQQQAMMMVQQQQQKLRQMQQLQSGRKRKLPSVALCIKDGRVYSKPFSHLHPALALANNNSDKEKPQPPAQQQQVYHATFGRQPNPYASTQPYQNPYQPQPGSNPLSSVSQLYQRLGQKPSTIDNDRSSVDNDDYRSDEDDFEVMDGQEINEDDESRDESYHSDDIQSCEDITEVNGAKENSKEAIVPSSGNPMSGPPEVSDESADIPDDSDVNTENESSNDAAVPEPAIDVPQADVDVSEPAEHGESVPQQEQPQEAPLVNDPIAEAIYSAEVNQEVMEPAEVSNDDEMLENEDSQEGGVSL